MRVRMLTNYGGAKAGDVVDLPDADAQRLVRRQRAAVLRGTEAETAMVEPAAEQAAAPPVADTQEANDDRETG